MTRLLLLLSLLASIAFGQTYVRPSKGVPINPFPDAGSTFTIPDAGSYTIYSPVWDWSAFEAARIRITGVGSSTSNTGRVCNSLTTQYTVAELGNFVQLRLQQKGVRVQTYPALMTYDSYIPTGTFHPTTGINSSVVLPDFMGCPVSVRVTPIPFAPASVTSAISSTTLADGGTASSGAQTFAPYACGSTTQTTYVMDGGAVTIGSMDPRQYVVVCNSRENSSGNVRCRADGTAPVTTAGSAGTVLAAGDCVPYTESTVQCAASSALYVTSYECGP